MKKVSIYLFGDSLNHFNLYVADCSNCAIISSVIEYVKAMIFRKERRTLNDKIIWLPIEEKACVRMVSLLTSEMLMNFLWNRAMYVSARD